MINVLGKKKFLLGLFFQFFHITNLVKFSKSLAELAKFILQGKTIPKNSQVFVK
jgi:hypothetical protein